MSRLTLSKDSTRWSCQMREHSSKSAVKREATRICNAVMRQDLTQCSPQNQGKHRVCYPSRQCGKVLRYTKVNPGKYSRNCHTETVSEEKRSLLHAYQDGHNTNDTPKYGEYLKCNTRQFAIRGWEVLRTEENGVLQKIKY